MPACKFCERQAAITWGDKCRRCQEKDRRHEELIAAIKGTDIDASCRLDANADKHYNNGWDDAIEAAAQRLEKMTQMTLNADIVSAVRRLKVKA